MNAMTVYLAGKIDGDPGYRQKFTEAARELERIGYTVLSPAILPSEGFSRAAYMHISRAMQDACDAICLLPDWESSLGAIAEKSWAEACGQMVIFFEDRAEWE